MDSSLAAAQPDINRSKTAYNGGKASIMIEPKYWTS
jgi:hypothetical protein